MPVSTPTLKSLLDLPEDRREPMSRRLTEAFVKLTIMEHDGGEIACPVDWMDPATGILAPMRDDSSLQILCERMLGRSPGTRVTLAAATLVLSMCQTPGQVVMWAYAFHLLHRQLGRTVGMVELAAAFPVGFPSDAGYSDVWVAQKGFTLGKGDVDNALDQEEPWR